MRLAPAAAFVFLVALSARAQPFREALADGKHHLADADAFTFRDGSQSCRVAANGRALCDGNNERDWAFRLPVGAERIEALSFLRYGRDLVIAYTLNDGESGWGQIVRIAPGAKRPSWRFQVRGLNMAKPVLHQDSIVVAALAFRARVNVETGSADWLVENAYDGSGFEIPEVRVAGTEVVVRSRDGRTRRIKSECFEFNTGAPVSCGSQAVTQPKLASD